MTDFFISYNSNDLSWAEWIAWVLEENSYSTILQTWDFRPGSNFILEMQKATAEATCTIAILSSAYLASEYAQPEWAAAFAKDPRGIQGCLIPVRVEPIELEGLLSQIVYIDLVGKDENNAQKELIQGVKKGRAKPQEAPGFPGKVSKTTVSKPLSFPGTVFPPSQELAPYVEKNEILNNQTHFLTIPLKPGIGNAHLSDHYISPPSGDVDFGCVRFNLSPDSLIFDTGEQIRYYSPKKDGSKEIEIMLPEPKESIKAVYLLINSGNSKKVYLNQSIGQIRLIFKDALPINTELVLGENIRDWCPGNKGEYVRETNSQRVKQVWNGINKEGSYAVIDCLKIPVDECMRNNALEKIILVHRDLKRLPEDSKGVQYLVFAITLESD